MKKLTGIIALFGFAFSTLATESYLVSAKIFDGKNLVGSPSMIVRSNIEVSMSVDGLYSLDYTISPLSGALVNLDVKLVVGDEQMSPKFMLELDENVSFDLNGKSFSMLINKSSN